MELLKLFAHRDPKNAKIVLATTLGVAAIVGVATTDTGARILSQVGVRDGIAQTVAAAERGLQQAGDALKSFVGRSPGERGATDILKGKKKRTALAKAKDPDSAAPEQRALGKIFDKPIESVAPAAIAPPVAAVALPDTVAFEAPVAGLPLAFINPRILAPGIGGVGGGGSGGGGGGSGGGGGGGVVPPTVPTVIGAIPEPSTWLFMIFGFGAIGASLRRKTSTGALSMSQRAGHCETN